LNLSLNAFVTREYLELARRNDSGEALRGDEDRCLPAKSLPDRLGVFVHRLVGKGDEYRNGDDQ
jgi:hypothetical protein